MNKRRRISSRDVAKEAGVSQATVSYVLNDVKNIKIRPETRQAVLDAVAKLNYHPSHIARGMKSNKSMAIGVITDRSVTNYYFMQTLEGIKDALKKHNYAITLLFNTSSEDGLDNEIFEYYSSNRLDGIIFAFANVDDSMIDELNDMGIPYVVIDSNSTGRDAYQVGTDHLEHIYELIQAFKNRGAVSIAYTGPLWRNKHDRRIDAFQQAAETAALLNRGCFLCPFKDDEIIEQITTLLQSNERPDCILAGSPRFGLFVLKCAARLGIAVPGELKVAALGTSIFFDLSHPSLSAIELPLYDMGFSGAEVLLNVMNGNDMDIDKTVILPSVVKMRESI